MSRAAGQFNWKRWIAVCLIWTLVTALFTMPASLRAMPVEPEIDLRFDFHAFSPGNLNGQQGWAAVGEKAQIIENAGRDGSQAVQINDQDSVPVNVNYRFTPLTEGKIEWWAKTDANKRLIAQLQQTTGGAKNAEWIGFNTDGRFVYYDGDTRVFSQATYQTNTWYHFSVEFDAVSQTKTVTISDEDGPIVREEGIGFWHDGITGLEVLRFSTISTDQGLYHLDNVRITSLLGEDIDELSGVAIVPESIQIVEGEESTPYIVGRFAHGGMSVMNGNAGWELQTSDPAVAFIENGSTIRGVNPGLATVSVTQSVYSANAQVLVVQDPEEIPLDLRFGFETFTAGPLNGQEGWFAAGNKANVITGDAQNGLQSVFIDDDDSTPVNISYSFPSLTEGKIEWWAKTDRINRLIAQLQQTTGGTKTAEWIGFYSDGRFVYYDGSTRKTSTATYQPNTWYRFSVEFDTAAQTKTISIFDNQGLVFREEGLAFWHEGITELNLLRFSTISTTLGAYGLDDVRITGQTEENLDELTDLRLTPKLLQLVAGNSAQPQIVGYFDHGGVQLLDSAQGLSLSSQDPAIAQIVNNRMIEGVSQGETTVTVSYEELTDTMDVMVYAEGEIPPYKIIEPRELQRETDLTALTIITPANPVWYQAGEEIADVLEQRWQIEATVVESDADDVGNGWSGNKLIIGNLSNNPHMARLYGLYLSYADAVHPGAGGYQLQTLVNPFGLGGNTIVMGVTDEDGLAAGITRLEAILDGLSAPGLPWLAETEMSEEAASFVTYGLDISPEVMEDLYEAMDNFIAELNPDSTHELAANHLLRIFERVMFFGKWYQITNDPGYGELYKYSLDAYADFVNSYPDTAKAQLASVRNMWTSGFSSVGVYTVMEASPLFSEKDRERYISALYLTYEANARDHYLVKAPEQGPRNNHDAYPALSLIFGAMYFQKYHEFPESDEWYEIGEQIFTGNTTNINIDEGSEYLLHVPTLTLEYAMATGDHDFLLNGLRPSADLKAMMIDNLGTQSAGGDTYPFGYSSAYSWNHSQVLNAATWFFSDPTYQFLLERTRTGPFDGQRMPDLTNPFHRYTIPFAENVVPEAEMVKSFPIESGLYDMIVDEMEALVNVDIEDSFHKLSFRKGFETDDDYLMIDGFSAGRHGHLDGNAIIKYSANGRIFMDDRDYIEKAPKNHSGLVVMKEGEQFNKPPLTKLEWAADAGGTGVSRSQVLEYNGTDWTRSIISPGGEFFLIYDDIDIREPGDYVFENTWQTLGDINLTDDQLTVEQQGVFMTIQSLDDSDLRSYERYGHFLKYWKSTYPYPYADEEHVLRQVKESESFLEGDRTGYINVLASHVQGDTPIHASIVDEETILIEKGTQQWYAIWSPQNSLSLDSNAVFGLFGEEEVMLAEVTSVRIGTTELTFDQPVLLTYREQDGHWEAFRLRKGSVKYDEEGQPIDDGIVDSGTAPSALGLINEVRASGTATIKPSKPSPNYEDDWTLQLEFGEEITASAAADINGDGQKELIVGGVSGLVKAYTGSGALLWTFQANGRINEITIGAHQGTQVIMIGTEDWYVHVLNANGIENWHTEIPNTSAHREFKGNLLGITNLQLAYLNGLNQEPWIMVGTQFRYLYGFDLQGQKQYEDIVYFYGIPDMVFADLDGDGREEGVIATEYYYYAILDNGNLTRIGGSTGPGPGYTVVEPVYNWGPSDETAIVYGTKLNWVRLFQYDGTRVTEAWSRNVGGEVNGIVAGDFDGDSQPEIVVASDSFYVYLLNADGTVRWKTYVGDRVMAIAHQAASSGPLFIATLDNGSVMVLDALGGITDSYLFDHLVNEVHTDAASGRMWSVLQSGEVYVNLP